MGRHGQSSHCRFNPLLLFPGRFAGFFAIAAVSWRGNGSHVVEAVASRLFLADFQIAQHGPDRVAFIQVHQKFLDAARARCGHVHGRFVGLDFENVLIGLDPITGLDQEANDGGLGNRFPELRHDNG